MQLRFREQETEYKKYKTQTQHTKSKMPGKMGGGDGALRERDRYLFWAGWSGKVSLSRTIS